MAVYKLWEIAQQAIDLQDKRMAEGLILLVHKRQSLSPEGLREYLRYHGVDLDSWDELTASI